MAGDFLAGVLATILATPCSAPFVGVAIGVALTGSLAELFGIFIALGVGLATPWILIMIAPGLISALPKPGMWMVWLKKTLALLLVGTALWLGSILFVISGTVITGILCVGIIMVIWGLTGYGRIFPRLSVLVGSLVVLGMLVVPPPFVVTSGPKAATSKGLFSDNVASAVDWQSWQPAMVELLVDEGKTVFVDVTAAWCLTCKANKSLVIDRAPVASHLRQMVDEGNLVLLQADWTRPNDEITAFLESHQRFGIPFNVIYGPHAPEGIQLDELLTDDTVLAALNRAMSGS